MGQTPLCKVRGLFSKREFLDSSPAMQAQNDKAVWISTQFFAKLLAMTKALFV